MSGDVREPAPEGSIRGDRARRPDSRRGPRLTWPGRKWRAGEPRLQGPPLRPVERHGPSPAGRLVHGDCLDVAAALTSAGLDGAVDLIYVDPPFASQASYTQEVRLDGPADGRVKRTRAYDDSWPDRRRAGAEDLEDGVGAYLDMLAPRLEAMAALLAPTGSLWVHLDWRAAYLVRVLLDELLGRDRFLNEIVWRRAPNLGRQAASGQFGRTLDTLVVYGGPRARLVPPTRLEPIAPGQVKRDDEGRAFTTAPRGDYTDASMRRLAAEGRVHTTASGRQYVKYFLEPNAAGELCRERRIDTLWTDIPPLRHVAVSERTGFPTQKPRALLERIIRCASPEGGLVVDLFCGSGTTGEVAASLGRRFVVGDQSPVALNTARARLMRAGASFSVESCGGSVAPCEAVPEVRVSRPDLALEVRVELVEPAEPLAWAIAPAPVGDAPFVPFWHSERRPGAVPVPAAREAALPAELTGAAGRGGVPLEVRVYGDDGSVAARRCAAEGGGA